MFREAVAKVAFPLYGLPPDWPGRRFLGGGQRSWPEPMDCERDPGVLHSLGLVHGTNVQGEGPMLVVETALPDADSGGGPLRVAAERLWAGRVSTEGEPSRPGDPWLRLVRSSAEIHVDGQPVLLDVVTSADNGAWVGRGQLPACRLTLEAEEFPVDDIELVRVLDVAPYR